MAKFKLQGKDVSIEKTRFSVASENADRRIRWYEARGWTLVSRGDAFVWKGKSYIVLSFERRSTPTMTLTTGD